MKKNARASQHAITGGVFDTLLGAFSLPKIGVSRRYAGVRRRGRVAHAGGRVRRRAVRPDGRRPAGERGRAPRGTPMPQWPLGKLRRAGCAEVGGGGPQDGRVRRARPREGGMLRRPAAVSGQDPAPFYGDHVHDGQDTPEARPQHPRL